MTTASDEAPVPYRRSTGRRGMSPRGRALAGYVAFFSVAMVLFGGMILLSLLS